MIGVWFVQPMFSPTFHAKVDLIMCLFQPLTTHTECDTIGRSLLSSCIKDIVTMIL